MEATDLMVMLTLSDNNIGLELTIKLSIFGLFVMHPDIA